MTPRARLAPVLDRGGGWAVTDRGEERHRAPLGAYRVSVLWKADIYRDEEERRRLTAETLSIPDVAQIFDRDLSERGAGFRFDLDRIEAPGFVTSVQDVYPEPVPVAAAASIFDPA